VRKGESYSGWIATSYHCLFRAVVSIAWTLQGAGFGKEQSGCVPVHCAEGRERGLLRSRVPGLYVGQDFEEDFIGEIVCVCGHGKDTALESLCGDYRYPKMLLGGVVARTIW
jgi:hypothetical protein